MTCTFWEESAMLNGFYAKDVVLFVHPAVERVGRFRLIDDSVMVIARHALPTPHGSSK